MARLSSKVVQDNLSTESKSMVGSARMSLQAIHPLSKQKEEQETNPTKPNGNPKKKSLRRRNGSSTSTGNRISSQGPFQRVKSWSQQIRRSVSNSPKSGEKNTSSETDLCIQKATEALEKFQSHDSDLVRKGIWSAQDEEILANNINLLRGRLEESLHTDTEFPARRRKRSLSESNEDEYDVFMGSDLRNQTRSKRTKASSKRKLHRVPLVLEEVKPQPIRIDYAPHPQEDRSDEWFVTMFRQLFHMCDTFAESFFGNRDVERGVTSEPLNLRLCPEFISWVDQVCEEDELVGGWDYVFRNTNQRRWLVFAVLMRILRVKIFDDDLWGAGKEERNMLVGIDKALLNREGFERTLLRSQTVRTILGQSPVTRNFYIDVAHLTAQITLLFQPLSDYLTCTPQPEANLLPQFQDQYQILHNIISSAAYLSICVRLSPTIFHLVNVRLGNQYDPDDHWNLDWENWKRSEKVGRDLFKEQREAWEQRERKARRAFEKLVDEGKQNEPEGMRAQEVHRVILAEMPRHSYGAQTTMSVWPVITRYKPGSVQDDLNEAHGVKTYLRDRDGFRIFQISKAAVIIGYGHKVMKRKTSLQDFLNQNNNSMAVRDVWFWNIGVAATTAALIGAGWIWKEVLKETIRIDVLNGFAALG